MERPDDLPEELEIVNPNELKLEMALQLLAVFVHRFGGDLVISKNEFEMVEGLDIFATQLTPGHLRLRFLDEEEDEFSASPDSPLS